MLVLGSHYHIGLGYANCDDHESAIPAFTASIEAPHQPSGKLLLKATHERAKCLQLQGRLAEALRDFTAVLRMSPVNAHALFRRAFAYKAMKRYDEAAADFEAARAADPDNPHLVVNYSQLHEVDCIVLCAAGEEPDFD